MIITQTPLRISFFGGGTDYPDYFKEHGGSTLTASIDRYTLIIATRVNDLADYAFRVQYSKMETVMGLEEIQHPGARECFRFFNIARDLEIHYFCDLPARTGMGSSSSATVGLIHALHAYRNEHVSRQQLAEESIYVEQELINERVGCQDQYACALGGFLHLEFEPSGNVRINPLTLNRERIRELEKRLMLIYTGITRTAHEVLDEQIERTKSGQNKASLAQMKPIVDEGVRLLSSSKSLEDFGQLLHANWKLKKELSRKITAPWIDEAYEEARRAGAIGGKLLGAGGGGFLLLYVEPDKQDCVRNALFKLRQARFSFESGGSRIIFYRY